MRNALVSRAVTALAATTLLALSTAAPAAARIEPQPTPTPTVTSTAAIDRTACPLTRIGTQFTRCDDLTGAGKSAPAWVPEQR